MNLEYYNENNPEHKNSDLYEVVEQKDVINDGRRPSYVVCGDILSDAQRR